MKNILILFFSIILLIPSVLRGQETDKKVYVFKIDKDIDPAMNRRVKIAMEEAEKLKADLILIEMDTYGGAVTDADDATEGQQADAAGEEESKD
mgnify:CR=1 FL=1